MKIQQRLLRLLARGPALLRHRRGRGAPQLAVALLASVAGVAACSLAPPAPEAGANSWQVGSPLADAVLPPAVPPAPLATAQRVRACPAPPAGAGPQAEPGRQLALWRHCAAHAPGLRHACLHELVVACA